MSAWKQRVSEYMPFFRIQKYTFVTIKPSWEPIVDFESLSVDTLIENDKAGNFQIFFSWYSVFYYYLLSFLPRGLIDFYKYIYMIFNFFFLSLSLSGSAKQKRKD